MNTYSILRLSIGNNSFVKDTVLYILLLHVLFQDNAKDTFRGIYRFLYI